MRKRRRSLSTSLALLVTVSLLSAPACAVEPKDRTSTSQQNVSAERARELEHLVRQDCGSCHGMTLKGGLGPGLTPERLASTDRASIASIILDGVPDTPMPPWRPLISETDAVWIADYLLTGRTP
ncbi:MAG: cytochrome c [Hyphomicrobiaceae bacterium]|nr:cytochrome c [Hyphomicrobiaceae bacterium]